MESGLWRVVGGETTGGIVVRTQRGAAAPEADCRLGTGSLIRELARERNRMQYELVEGEGPQAGWVSVTLGSRPLLEVEAAEAGAAQPSPEGAAQASRQRIAGASTWHAVLDVAPMASAGEVRRAFRELALLHHPDKHRSGSLSPAEEDGSDAAETFRRVQEAYEEGLVEAARHSEEVAPLEAPMPQGVRPVPINAPKAQLRAACDFFEDRVDLAKSVCVPDDIPYIDVEQLARWLAEGTCVPIDAREPSERSCAGKHVAEIPGTVSLSYTRLLKSPETLVPELARLQGYADRGIHFVSYSMSGSPTSGNCAIVCCLLVDVFGFSPGIMHCLEEGYKLWSEWARKNASALEKIRARY